MMMISMIVVIFAVCVLFQNCSDLVKVLNRGDFKELMGHLEGLANIYQINGDK